MCRNTSLLRCFVLAGAALFAVSLSSCVGPDLEPPFRGHDDASPSRPATPPSAGAGAGGTVSTIPPTANGAVTTPMSPGGTSPAVPGQDSQAAAGARAVMQPTAEAGDASKSDVDAGTEDAHP